MTWITANFPNLSEQVRNKVVAGTTTRVGGISAGDYAGLNIAAHVGDDSKNVAANRAILREQLSLPSEPYWLTQTHSKVAVEIPYQYRPHPSGDKDSMIDADAAFTKLARHVCAVMTADCLPLLIVDDAATEVAAIHAGWRGLADGVITSTVEAMNRPAKSLHVWLGPAIGPTSFEVGAEVKQTFVDLKPENEVAFLPAKPGKFLCDIYQLARLELKRLGVEHISGGEHCTVLNPELFYSYRRDGQTGRMASLIWLTE